ncbi:MAG TPA: bifunctional adenosylcobinamide kinase/adenosylcobinamide-phosphate guanylyltransferase [Bryobacteraceae bacterium]|nr:bifunctional adenosylcobinamide kinase/adenosylcobinamide-phosphate guanylyltransferase [Bryobacteraceae bacterium]
MLILVGGGSRSGKSRYAVELATKAGAPIAFIATAELLDEEMRARASAHQKERGAEFRTYEEPVDLAGAVRNAVQGHKAVVIDCLTLWASNLLLRQRSAVAEAPEFLRTAAEAPVPVIAVSNEVGCGIVPENALARQFRDEAGKLNQMTAAAASEAWWMAFGLPLRLK